MRNLVMQNIRMGLVVCLVLLLASACSAESSPKQWCVTNPLKWEAQIPLIECEALLSLYDSTGGDQWERRRGWLGFGSPCTWRGVFCAWGHVTEIHLSDNELTGSIPPELGNMSQLQELYLSNNELTGSIPPKLGNMSQLWGLYLSGNELTGSIPPELGNMSQLQGLYLSNNELTGSTPPELGNLSQLQELYLSNNELTGSIPPELGILSQLQ
jgi:hypothetical protein